MPKRAKVDLAKLRDIGWSKWDPIGLREKRAQADIEDEYDRYLLRAASLLLNGAEDSRVTDYLVGVAKGMGLSTINSAAATETVREIRAHIGGMKGTNAVARPTDSRNRSKV